MYIKVKEKFPVAIDGIHIETYAIGAVVNVPESVRNVMVKEGAAEDTLPPSEIPPVQVKADAGPPENKEDAKPKKDKKKKDK